MILPTIKLPESVEIGVAFSICCLLFQDVSWTGCQVRELFPMKTFSNFRPSWKIDPVFLHEGWDPSYLA